MSTPTSRRRFLIPALGALVAAAAAPVAAGSGVLTVYQPVNLWRRIDSRRSPAKQLFLATADGGVPRAVAYHLHCTNYGPTSVWLHSVNGVPAHGLRIDPGETRDGLINTDQTFGNCLWMFVPDGQPWNLNVLIVGAQVQRY